MFEQISEMIYKIDGVIWGWWLIILLLGTHIFMTIPYRIYPEKDDQ